MLVRLLYASRAETTTGAVDIDAIVARSRQFNPERGITGVLCFSAGLFMQVLEGSRDEVNQLYAEIVRDSRHRDVLLLDYAEVTERRFSSWTMGRVNLAKVNPSLLLKYSEKPVLDPYAISGKVALALIEELISTASVIGRNEAG
ncbi:MAG: BLUF domain-containing protein [Quisquiliibacterium sp.]